MSQDYDTAEFEPVNRLSPLPPLLWSPNRYMLILAVGIVAALVALLLGVPLTYAAVWVAIPAMLVAAFYVQAVYRIAKERRTRPWQREVQPEARGNWVSRATFHRICFVLNEQPGLSLMENVVNLVTRKSIWRFLRVAIPCGVLALVLLVEALLHPTMNVTTESSVGHKVTTSDHVHMTKYHTVTEHHVVNSGVFFLLLALVALAVILFAWIDWYYTYHMITNINVKLLKVPPLWLPFLRRVHSNVKLRTIGTNDSDDTAIGNMLGYGNVIGDTPVQRDDALRHMNWMPRHHEVNDILEGAVETARRNNL